MIIITARRIINGILSYLKIKVTKKSRHNYFILLLYFDERMIDRLIVFKGPIPVISIKVFSVNHSK